MKQKLLIFLLTGIVFQLIIGCSTKWTQAIQSGEISQIQFKEAVDIEIQNGLIFVPVVIKGKEYRFLFDSGAPFSISNQLQKEHAFKIVSKGNIIDSDHNKKKVNWSQVDAITIGAVQFIDQTAFIGDFEANPIFKCLEIDGIIGSNLMRQCNWTIDQKQKSLTLYKGVEEDLSEGGITRPFKTDIQYNIFTDITIGQALLRNVLVDYGSNGSIALNKEIFSTLKGRGIIDETWNETGTQQSGIVGEKVNINREILYSDSVSVDSLRLKKVMLKTGKTVSIGNSLLSRFRVTIDWENKNLHLFQTVKTKEVNRMPGFKLGFSSDLGVYTQSVVVNSNAYHKGIRPNMQVAKIDELDFEISNDFCDYVNHKLGDIIFMELIDSSGNRREYHFKQTDI